MFNIPACLVKPNNKYLNVAIEGVDGCGKTTLCKKLEESDEQILFARIPDAYTKKPFKDYLIFSTTFISSALIYAASLVDRYDRINSCEGKKIAVTDRSIWSTVALLYARSPESVQMVLDVYASIASNLAIPDVVYVIDVPFEVCRERINLRDASVKKYDDMVIEEYNKHLECYRLLKEYGVNIKFIQAANMSIEEEIKYILEGL